MKSTRYRNELAAASLALATSFTSSLAIAQQRSSAAPATAAPASSGPASAPIDVEPGVRFGALHLGMTSGQVSAAMPSQPLRPDTSEGEAADGSTGAFIGPFTLRFTREGRLTAITARVSDLVNGVRIGTRTIPLTVNASGLIAVLRGCGARMQVGGGYTTRCTGADVEDMTGASGLRLRVHR